MANPPSTFAAHLPSGTAGASHTLTSRISVTNITGGQAVWVPFFYKATRVTGTDLLTVRVQMDWYDSADAALSPTFQDYAINATVGWTFAEPKFLAPAGAVRGTPKVIGTPAASPTQHDLWVTALYVHSYATGAAPGGTIAGGPSSRAIKYTDTNVLDEPLPISLTGYKFYIDGLEQTSGVTWSYVVTSGGINGVTAASGSQSLAGPSFPITAEPTADKTTVVITAQKGTTTGKFNLEITKALAQVPVGGGGGSLTTLVSKTSSWSSVNSTSFVVISGTTLNGAVMPAGKTTAELAAAVTFTPTATGAGTITFTIELKWQRLISGTWTDVGSPAVVSGTTQTERYPLEEGGFDWIVSPVTLTNNKTVTGLTASTSYDWRLVARYTSGTNTHTVTGQASVKA